MKFIDHNSPEKAIINNAFNSLSYMDMWISSIVEGYIYEKVDKITYNGGREEYVERYGNIEGEAKNWHRNGQLWIQKYYKDGKEEGEYKVWYCEDEKVSSEPSDSREERQLHIQCYYKDGIKEGECKCWYPNGQLMSQKYFKEGKIDGEYKEWYQGENGQSIGQLKIQSYFREGKEEGEYKYYWFRGENGQRDNSQLWRQCYYKEGKLEGEYKQWYRGADGQGENGQLKYQCYHKEGKYEGEFKRWDEDGSLSEYKIYRGGEVIQDLLSGE